MAGKKTPTPINEKAAQEQAEAQQQQQPSVSLQAAALLLGVKVMELEEANRQIEQLRTKVGSQEMQKIELQGMYQQAVVEVERLRAAQEPESE